LLGELLMSLIWWSSVVMLLAQCRFIR